MKHASISISLANQSHDDVLRSLLRSTPLHGAFVVTVEREPSFFSTESDSETLIAFHHDQCIACGTRSISYVYWYGEICKSAYLRDLRIHPNYQGRVGRLLPRGYQAIKVLDEKNPVTHTWTAVWQKNHNATKTITQGRAGLPQYFHRGLIHCSLIWTKLNALLAWRDEIETGNHENWHEIVAYLQHELPLRNLAPDMRDFSLPHKLYPDLQMNDFIVLRKEGVIAAVVAVWDMRKHKQIRIHSHSQAWKVIAWLTQKIPLLPVVPPEGGEVAMSYTTFFCVKDHDVQLAKKILIYACVMAKKRKLEYLCVCRHETDPTADVIKELFGTRSDGMLYQVSYENVDDMPTDTCFHLESALL